MDIKAIIKITIIIGCFIVAAVLLANQFLGNKSGNPDDAPGGYWFQCSNREAHSGGTNDFNLSGPGYRDAVRNGGLVRCPSCNSPAVVRMYKCDACSKLYSPVGHGERPPNCPHCGAETMQSIPGGN